VINPKYENATQEVFLFFLMEIEIFWVSVEPSIKLVIGGIGGTLRPTLSLRGVGIWALSTAV
jgi:hypothetical protein